MLNYKTVKLKQSSVLKSAFKMREQGNSGCSSLIYEIGTYPCSRRFCSITKALLYLLFLNLLLKLLIWISFHLERKITH